MIFHYSLLFLIIIRLKTSKGYAYNATGARFLQDGQEYARIVVGYTSSPSPIEEDYFAGQKINHKFKRSTAVTMTIPVSEIDTIKNLPYVDYVEEDALVYAFDADYSSYETVPWGISIIQGDRDDEVPSRNESLDCFSICIVDSGILLSHADLVSRKKVERRRKIRVALLLKPVDSHFLDRQRYKFGDWNVMGSSFGVSDAWYESVEDHGIHIAGTILATAHNDIGVRGIISNASNFCLMVARVFGSVRTTSTSIIDEAVEWCVENGAKVINLSLGTSYRSRNSEVILQSIEEEDDVLIVAAAGNSGDSGTLHSSFYPASFSNVISVASVNLDLTVSDFSQRNDQVDICAPGKDILSLSALPEVILEDEYGELIESRVMANSVRLSTPLTAEVYDCDQGLEPCIAARDKFCIMSRGENAFEEKIRNCFLGGGLGMILYNNEPGNVDGNVGTNPPSIPALSVPFEEADRVLGASNLTIDIKVGTSSYRTMSGTSMAAPHVTGAIAKIWAAKPYCSKNQIRSAIINTAVDLGDEGRDDEYGAGLVQVVAAYNYLSSFPPPCGSGTGDFQAAKLDPTPSPTPSPTKEQETRSERARGAWARFRGGSG